MEVSDGSDGVATHHSELIDVPIREVRLVQDGHLVIGNNNKLSAEG